MSREMDKRIAEWLGWTPSLTWNGAFDCANGSVFRDITGRIKQLPRFSTSDADAITLLPILVERGYDCRLQSFGYDDPSERWQMTVWTMGNCDDGCITDVYGATIASAISRTVIALIERGQ